MNDDELKCFKDFTDRPEFSIYSFLLYHNCISNESMKHVFWNQCNEDQFESLCYLFSQIDCMDWDIPIESLLFNVSYEKHIQLRLFHYCFEKLQKVKWTQEQNYTFKYERVLLLFSSYGTYEKSNFL